jgi:CHAT domain-containing protein/tetratricopeptide (TPR) repeat protein
MNGRSLRVAAVLIAFIALAIWIVLSSAKHEDEFQTLNQQAIRLHLAGKYAEATDVANRALALAESQFDPNHPNVGAALNNLAELYRAQARYAKAEPLYKRALSIDEKALGPDHPNVGILISNLGALYKEQGRYAEAEPLMKRALSLAEKSLGLDDPEVGTRLNNLAQLYQDQRRYGEAEPLMKRALSIDEKALGPDHRNVGGDLHNIAELYRNQARYDEAEPLYRRALSIDEKALGPDHPNVGTNISGLAELYKEQGRYAEAEPLLKRALSIDENALGPDHPHVGSDLNNLAGLHFAQSDWARAADDWRGSANVIIRRAQRGTPVGEALTGKRKSEATQLNWHFWGLVKTVNRLARKEREATGLLREMFQAAQWAQSSEAAESLAQMAARGAKGDPQLAAFVRERQDLVAEWQRRDQVRSAAVAEAPDKRNREAEAENIGRLAAIDARIAIIDKELAANFPDYTALASPAPLSIEEVQAQLAADEALVLFLDTPEWKPTPEETFIWVVTKTDVQWVRSDLGTPALAREVAALRCGLDYDGSWFNRGAWDGERCNTLLNLQRPYGLVDHDVFGKPLPFDLARSYALYKALFGDVEDLIKGKRLLIVPSGPLTQLPFQVLVTKPPPVALPTSATDYRDVAWLVREHATTVLPAVSSLKAVRELAKESHASEKYIGFGNPLLDGGTDKIADAEKRAKILAMAKLAREARCQPVQQVKPVQTAALDPLGSRGPVTRGPNGLVEIADLSAWAPLPETADEVCGVANILRVDTRTHVYIGADAREKTVKRLSEDGELAKYKIVHFATHGALAGQLSPAAEPGLILTPPDKASEVDDGYLSASEVAALKLDADWVILSACNTAAGEASSAEALSGLARAFFYAGSRSLLVSHWYVASKTAVPLITTAIAMLTVDPKIGRAEALRRSILSMIDGGKDYEAHPAFWAPFVLVGEGGAAR